MWKNPPQRLRGNSLTSPVGVTHHVCPNVGRLGHHAEGKCDRQRYTRQAYVDHQLCHQQAQDHTGNDIEGGIGAASNNNEYSYPCCTCMRKASDHSSPRDMSACVIHTRHACIRACMAPHAAAAAEGRAPRTLDTVNFTLLTNSMSSPTCPSPIPIHHSTLFCHPISPPGNVTTTHVTSLPSPCSPCDPACTWPSAVCSTTRLPSGALQTDTHTINDIS